MAQETAGTIGIPVLKNEILPYLTDYAKRQERAELYKQKAAQRAAELAAKKAKEDEIILTSSGGSGKLYKKVTSDKIKQALDRTKAIVADQTIPRTEARLAAAQFKSDAEAFEKTDAQLEKEALEELKNINEKTLRTVEPSYLYEWGEKQPDYKPTKEFRNDVLSNPAFLDFNKINKKADGWGVRNLSLEAPGGHKGTKFKGSILYNYELADDPTMPIGGKKVPKITGVNTAVAKEFIKSDPELEKEFQLWTTNRAKEIEASGVDPVKAEESAVDEFLKKSFRGAPIEYGEEYAVLPSGRSGGSRGGKTTDFSTPVGPTDAYTPVYDARGVEIPDAGQNFEIGDSSDKVIPLSTTNHPAGLRAIPIRKIEAADASLLEAKGNGLYKLNRAFTYDNPKPRTVYRAAKDIDVTRGGKFAYRIKKGSILGNDYAGSLIADGRDSELSKEKGYEITARTKNPTTDEEREIVFFVPMAEAGVIKANISKFQKKKEDEEIKELKF